MARTLSSRHSVPQRNPFLCFFVFTFSVLYILCASRGRTYDYVLQSAALFCSVWQNRDGRIERLLGKKGFHVSYRPLLAGGVRIPDWNIITMPAPFSRKTAEANSVPSLLDKQTLVLSSGTKVLTTFGPDQGFIAEPEVGLVYASTSVLAHNMVSLAWLIENQQKATPRSAREGFLDDPNQNGLAVNLINRSVTYILGGGLSGFLSAETPGRYDLDSVWDDRVLREGFRMNGGVPELELAAADQDVPGELQARLETATQLS